MRNKSYYTIIKENVEDSDDFEGILRYLPDFYQILTCIAGNPKSSWYTKMLVNSALAYFVLEDDVIPDKNKKEGYLDDLFICAYVLKEIRDKISKEIILESLETCESEIGEDIFDMIFEAYVKSMEFLGDRSDKVLNLVGLSRFSSLDLLYAKDKVATITLKKRKLNLLYAMLSVKVKQILNDPVLDRKRAHLREYITKHPDYGEIKRFGAFIQK